MPLDTLLGPCNTDGGPNKTSQWHNTCILQQLFNGVDGRRRSLGKVGDLGEIWSDETMPACLGRIERLLLTGAGCGRHIVGVQDTLVR